MAAMGKGPWWMKIETHQKRSDKGLTYEFAFSVRWWAWPYLYARFAVAVIAALLEDDDDDDDDHGDTELAPQAV